MKRLKVMTVVGTRPEIIRLSSVINLLETSEAIDHCLVHTGQNYDYELNEVFFEDLELRKPDYFLDTATGAPVSTIGNVLTNIEPVILKEQPDAFLVLGDTNSCLSAIAAKRYKIPIFHMEAGNRCFDQRVPEETNRKIVDHIADINLTYSDIAREYLLREGIPADRVIKTGSPMYEVLHKQMDKIHASSILIELGLEDKQYFVVSAHREENINNPKMFNKLIGSLNLIAETYDMPLLLSTHPRTRKMLESSGLKLDDRIIQSKPLGFIDYNKLQMHAKAVLSDSGTISEEASILGFKALNLREAHERPEAMEEASVMMVGLNEDRILQALKVLETQTTETLRLPSDYSMPNVSEKVLRIIISYTDYVNRTVWSK